MSCRSLIVNRRFPKSNISSRLATIATSSIGTVHYPVQTVHAHSMTHSQRVTGIESIHQQMVPHFKLQSHQTTCWPLISRNFHYHHQRTNNGTRQGSDCRFMYQSRTKAASRISPASAIFDGFRRSFHTSIPAQRKENKEISSEPIKFTTSAANTKSLPPEFKEANPLMPVSLALSMAVLLLYFCILREENDIDVALAESLFVRVPAMEEPSLRSAIPRMREMGVDTREAEARLRELVQERQAREAKGREARN